MSRFSLQRGSNSYQSIKAVITQRAKWDRVIVRRGLMGLNLLLKLHRHHKRSTFPICHARCLTQGEAWCRWLFSALLWFDPAVEICCLFETLEQDRKIFKGKKRHICKMQFQTQTACLSESSFQTEELLFQGRGLVDRYDMQFKYILSYE